MTSVLDKATDAATEAVAKVLRSELGDTAPTAFVIAITSRDCKPNMVVGVAGARLGGIDRDGLFGELMRQIESAVDAFKEGAGEAYEEEES